MEIFVGNIGSQTSSGQVKRFFAQYAQKASKWQCSVMVAHGTKEDRTVYFAQVTLEPDSLALSAIKHLNQQKLNGKTLYIREYSQRSSYRKRSKVRCAKPGILDWLKGLLGKNKSALQEKSWDGKNRRCMDEPEDAEMQAMFQKRK
jgi:RNA recognition motif-containing protein